MSLLSPLVGNTAQSWKAADIDSFCFPSSGRELTQLMGQCQGRTHVLMPHMTPAARRFTATEENQQRRPTISDWPTKRALDSTNVTLRRVVGQLWIFILLAG